MSQNGGQNNWPESVVKIFKAHSVPPVCKAELLVYFVRNTVNNINALYIVVVGQPLKERKKRTCPNRKKYDTNCKVHNHNNNNENFFV